MRAWCAQDRHASRVNLSSVGLVRRNSHLGRLLEHWRQVRHGGMAASRHERRQGAISGRTGGPEPGTALAMPREEREARSSIPAVGFNTPVHKPLPNPESTLPAPSSLSTCPPGPSSPVPPPKPPSGSFLNARPLSKSWAAFELASNPPSHHASPASCPQAGARRIEPHETGKRLGLRSERDRAR